jgi:hypothetical protein
MPVVQMQHTSPQRRGRVGNTSINNEDGNGDVEFNELGTDNNSRMFMVPNISFLRH